MAEQKKQPPIVSNADGVPFTIYRVEKPAKSGPKTYWLLEKSSMGKRRTLNNVSIAEHPVSAWQPREPA